MTVSDPTVVPFCGGRQGSSPYTNTIPKPPHPHKADTKGCSPEYSISPGEAVLCRLQGLCRLQVFSLLSCGVGELVLSTGIILCGNGRIRLMKGNTTSFFLHVLSHVIRRCGQSSSLQAQSVGLCTTRAIRSPRCAVNII